MNHLDGFSGYGGFSLALEQAGWKFDKTYFSEVDKYAIANYKYNFPNAIYAGSITDVPTSGIIEKLDLFTFGWPCQDNSIAGKRKGQQPGTRSSLLYSAVEIISKYKPRNFVAENVAGLLSVNKGIDIIESIKILSFLTDSCPQYDIEMQLLNTRWFLPQNRERLFFIGHLRGSGSRKIFPIGEGFERTNEGPANSAVVRCITAGGHSGGKHSGMTLVYSDRGLGHILSISEGFVPALSSRPCCSHDHKIINQLGNIRRLTPLEFERLQGLPDNYTMLGIFSGTIKELSDTQRYKLCGNGVSIPPVKMIADKLLNNL